MRYLILGTGRWANIVQGALAGMGRATSQEGGTRLAGRSAADYADAWRGRIAASGAQIVWLATPPGEHVAPIADACIEARVHLIAEKPWLVEAAQSEALANRAGAAGILIGVHHQYVYLEAAERLKRDWVGRADAVFDGTFTTAKPNRLGLSAMANIGIHLLALRRFIDPAASIGTLDVGYERHNERSIALSAPGKAQDAIDFTVNNEPIVQRYIADFERCASEGAPFRCDLRNAITLAHDLRTVGG